MNEFFDKIGDMFADGITSVVTDNDYLFIAAMLTFMLCVIIEILLAYMNKHKKIAMDKGIFIGCLFLDITISLSSVFFCKLWLAIVICIISAIVIPIYERKELENALKKKIKIPVTKYLIYLFVTFISVVLGSIIRFIIIGINS